MTVLSYACVIQSNAVHVLFEMYRPMCMKESEINLPRFDDSPMFLPKEYEEDLYGPIPSNQTLIVSHVSNCFSFNELDLRRCVEHRA